MLIRINAYWYMHVSGVGKSPHEYRILEHSVQSATITLSCNLVEHMGDLSLSTYASQQSTFSVDSIAIAGRHSPNVDNCASDELIIICMAYS